jgi:phage/plasmid primase-like uncharacterized protein
LTSQLARNIWHRSEWIADLPDGICHPYLVTKGIDFGAGAKQGPVTGSVLGESADCVVVPVRTIGPLELQGVECINAQGKKQTFGKKLGGCFIFGDERQQDCCWYVHEGWASAAVSFRYHGARVSVCAFGKSQLDSVAKALADTYQPKEITVMREVDR